MLIGIVTDSTCDLPEELVAEHGISVVPLYINVGDESYLDGIDLSRQEFYESLPGWVPPPQTATPNPGIFQGIYERLADEGITEILSIHISASLSATLNAAHLAAREVTSAAVTVLDGGQVSLGTGLLVLAAAKAAAAGHSIGEIVGLLKDKMLRTHVFAALDTLEFLQRSGRMSWAVSKLGSVLRIKPLLKMHDGDPQIERVRTGTRAVARMMELVQDLGPLEELALIHTHAPEKLELLYQKAKHLFPKPETPLRAEVTPVIGTHVGPGAVGFACVAAGER
ncbi:MAG: DegV family protein [Anaerolineae bacterium]|jgi:DegV family protein with EDD domain